MIAKQHAQHSDLRNALVDFLHATKAHGIQTRIIECSIPLAFTPIHSQTNTLESAQDVAFLQEYDVLNAMSNDVISQALHIASKEKDATTSIMLELLIDIHQRLTHLEHHILHTQQSLLSLSHHGVLHGLGHGVLCSNDELFSTDTFYYARFSLPILSQRMISIFAKALSAHILQIVRIHSHNTQALDSFIVAKEMEQLREHNLRKRTIHD